MAKGYPPPKGRATAARDRTEARSSRLPPTLEWVLLAGVLLAVVVAAWYFTTGSDTTPHNGAAAPPAVELAVVTP